MSKKLVRAVASSLGLTHSPSPQLAYGIADGFLAQAYLVEKNSVKSLCVFFRYAATSREQEIRDALTAGDESQIPEKDLALDGGTATLTMRYRTVLGMPTEKVVLARVHALLAALKSNAAPEPATCRICSTAVLGDPVLLKGLVDRVCPGCVERLEHEADIAQAEYKARRMNLPLGLAAAAVAGGAGGLLYGGALALSRFILFGHAIAFAVAITAGAMVGYAAVKGAGRSGRLVQAMAVLVTLASVLVGLLGYLGYEKLVAQGGTVDWVDFAARSFQVLMAATHDTLVSVIAGVLGARAALEKTKLPFFRTVDARPKGQLTPI